MSIDNTTEDWREAQSRRSREEAGRIRWMHATLTSGAQWQVVGHLLIDSSTRETRQADIFSGIGFASRPAAGANVDTIVAFVGGPANPVIIATRDEDAARALGDLAQDSTAMFNRATVILIKPDGTVEIRAIGGAAAPLATKADIDALKSWAATHTHPVPGVTTGGATVPSSAPTSPPPSAVGTTKLKAQ